MEVDNAESRKRQKSGEKVLKPSKDVSGGLALNHEMLYQQYLEHENSLIALDKKTTEYRQMAVKNCEEKLSRRYSDIVSWTPVGVPIVHDVGVDDTKLPESDLNSLSALHRLTLQKRQHLMTTAADDMKCLTNFMDEIKGCRINNTIDTFDAWFTDINDELQDAKEASEMRLQHLTEAMKALSEGGSGNIPTDNFVVSSPAQKEFHRQARRSMERNRGRRLRRSLDPSQREMQL